MLEVRLGRYVQRGCYALSVRAFSSFTVCSGYDYHGLHYFRPRHCFRRCSRPGMFVYRIWAGVVVWGSQLSI